MNAAEAKKRADEYYDSNLLREAVKKTVEQKISNYSATGNFCLNITAGDFEHVPWRLSPKQRERYRESVSESMFLSEYFVRFREIFCQTMRWVAKDLSKDGFYAELKYGNGNNSPFLFIDWADAIYEGNHFKGV